MEKRPLLLLQQQKYLRLYELKNRGKIDTYFWYTWKRKTQWQWTIRVFFLEFSCNYSYINSSLCFFCTSYISKPLTSCKQYLAVTQLQIKSCSLPAAEFPIDLHGFGCYFPPETRAAGWQPGPWRGVTVHVPFAWIWWKMVAKGREAGSQAASGGGWGGAEYQGGHICRANFPSWQAEWGEKSSGSGEMLQANIEPTSPPGLPRAAQVYPTSVPQSPHPVPPLVPACSLSVHPPPLGPSPPATTPGWMAGRWNRF